ncbi:hypothetical protein PWT90_00698 [Aphanocladium album]|nr:hypothetical protein PWT90_00698 [Aphanocladium album]
MAPLPLELAVFSADDALAAQSLGAARVELNAPGSYPAGGLTPPVAALAALSPQLRIPVRVMIRPRGPPPPPPPPPDGDSPDFLYTPAELDLMRAAIADIKASGAINVARGDGFVFGILKRSESSEKLTIDAETCRELVALARPVPCVFHRAFDVVAGSDEALDALIECGFEGLLTAGGDAGKYIDNLARLERICERAAGRIQVVAGGGVRHHNVAGPAAALAKHGEGRVWVHSAALKEDGSGVDEGEVRRLLEELAK